jgi:hypothetical protein
MKNLWHDSIESGNVITGGMKRLKMNANVRNTGLRVVTDSFCNLDALFSQQGFNARKGPNSIKDQGISMCERANSSRDIARG